METWKLLTWVAFILVLWTVIVGVTDAEIGPLALTGALVLIAIFFYLGFTYSERLANRYSDD